MLRLILLLVLKVCSSSAVEAISGCTITLTCPLQGSSFQWQRLVNTVWSTLQEGAKYGNVNTSSLIIYHVDPRDHGSYSCAVGTQQISIQVTVIGIAIEGSTTTLTCPLQGSSFKWNKLNHSYWSILEQGAKYGNVNTGYLAIYNVDPYDGGTYSCTTDIQQLPVYMKIVFRAIAMWGSNTTLTCTLQGSYYYWQTRTGPDWSSHIQVGAKYGNVNSGYMTIYNVQIDDGGRYRCRDYYNLEQIEVSVRVNGFWGSWGRWTPCTKMCDGTVTRYRACDNPSPVNGGSPCPGLHNETGSCSTNISCPVNGNWGTWQDWNLCSEKCGSGSRSRYQKCNNPEPAYGGSTCQGNDTEIDSCSIKLCPGSEDDHSSATIGIGAGIGSTAVVIGLLIVFIYIIKRYRLRKPAESAIYVTTGNTGSSNSDLHIYNGLQQNTESPTHRQNDVTYVNTNI